MYIYASLMLSVSIFNVLWVMCFCISIFIIVLLLFLLFCCADVAVLLCSNRAFVLIFLMCWFETVVLWR